VGRAVESRSLTFLLVEEGRHRPPANSGWKPSGTNAEPSSYRPRVEEADIDRRGTRAGNRVGRMLSRPLVFSRVEKDRQL